MGEAETFNRSEVIYSSGLSRSIILKMLVVEWPAFASGSSRDCSRKRTRENGTGSYESAPMLVCGNFARLSIE